MKTYPDYKNTDQLWLPEIPKKWQTIKIKYAFWERSVKGYPNEPLLVSSQSMGVVPKALYGGRTVEAQKDLHLLKLVRVGDFVISLRSFQGGIEYAYYQGIISPAYTIMVSRDVLDSGYFRYLAKSYAFIELLKSCVTGIREGQNIDYAKLKNHRIPIPSRPEQDQIVRFLDWKVASINKLISIKRKQIALLHEWQSVHISHIVTHGLRDGVAAKNSGAEWLGDIPEHWQVMRCKYLFSERDERSQDGSEHHLSMSQKYGLVPDSQLDERRMLSESYVGGKLCYKDDLVLNRLKAHLGAFALAPQSGVISPDYTVLRPNTERILPSFAETVLKSDRCRGELYIRVRGIIEGFWRLYTDDFNTIVLPVPPLDEQAEIMEYIVEFCDKAKKYEDTLTQEISSLQELKACLISDTVTGKIDVRNIEIPDYELVEEVPDEENDKNFEAVEGETYEE